MNWTSLKVVCSLPLYGSLGVLLTLLPSATAHAQGDQAAANAVLLQLSSAFSGGSPVRSVQITGVATWHSGSIEDSGSVTLNASADGSSEMQLQLAASGQRNETQTDPGSDPGCQWSAADGATHQIDFGNCFRPTVWFLPALSLQPGLESSNLGAVDLGTGPVGSSGNQYRHVQSQLFSSNLPIDMARRLAQQSTTDLGIDPTSMLPAVLTYSVHPDNGADVQVAIEVRYSDYHAVNGVQVPFRIERYINNSLQLEISVNSVQIS